jgi:hypothetical protein
MFDNEEKDLSGFVKEPSFVAVTENVLEALDCKSTGARDRVETVIIVITTEKPP